MRFFYRLLAIAILLGLVGGGVFLMTWDIPPPSTTIEKVIPNERFTR